MTLANLEERKAKQSVYAVLDTFITYYLTLTCEITRTCIILTHLRWFDR